MESRPCNVCQSGLRSDGTRYLGEVNRHHTYRCPACRLVFVYPKLTFDELDGIYDSYHDETDQLELNQAGETDLFQEILRRLGSAKGQASGELLDIGASFGHFLDLARKQGYTTKGVEIAKEPSEYARTVLGLDVECMSLEDAHFESERFSAVSLLNVLEHVPDPFKVLTESWRITKPGGTIAIVVPNLLLAYPYLIATRSVGLKLNVPTSAYHVPFHLTLFGPASLRWMLSATGWQNIEITNAPVIRNRSRAKTLIKQTVRSLGDGLAMLTGGALIYGYSLLAIAQREKR